MTTTQINVRFPNDLLGELDTWRAGQPVTPSRAATILEAVRRLLAAEGGPTVINGITIETNIENDWALAEMQGDSSHRLKMYIDIEERTLEVYARHESDNAWTAREHHGHAMTLGIPPMSSREFRALLDTVCPLVAELAKLYSSEWDGANHVARWSDHDRAEELRHELEEAAYDASCAGPEGSLWDAAEWMDADPPTVAADATDEALEELAADIQADAHHDGVHLYDLDEYLAELRDESADAEEK